MPDAPPPEPKIKRPPSSYSPSFYPAWSCGRKGRPGAPFQHAKLRTMRTAFENFFFPRFHCCLLGHVGYNRKRAGLNAIPPTAEWST